MPDRAASPRERLSPLAVAALILVLAGVTFWARTTSYRSVFPPSGEVELVPTDSHFYVRFALLQLHAFPRITTHDPYINHPEGAQLYVPVPHAAIVAAFIASFGESRAELAAAWVGPVVGTLEWAVIALMAIRVFGRTRGLAIAALWSLAPAIVEVAALGNADHHVHEPMFASASLLVTVLAVRSPSRRIGILAGAVLGAARWLTPTGFLFLPLAGLALLGAGLLRRDAAVARAATWTGVSSAAVLLVGVALFGRFSGWDYEQFSLFHPALAVCALVGAAGVTWWAAGARKPALLAIAVAVIAGLPLAAQVVRAGSHMGRADPLLSLVYESEPLWSDWSWALELLGPFLVAMVPAVLGLAMIALRASGATAEELPGETQRGVFRRVDAAAVLAFALPLSAAGMMQARFSPLLAASIAVACVVGLPALLPRARTPRTAVIGGTAVLAASLLVSLAPKPFREAPRDLLLSRPTLHWIRDHLPPASPDPFSSSDRPTYGVITSHLLGHVVPLWAQRPTVATMLSQDPSFIAANARAAAVLAAEDDESAYAAAQATDARYVVVTPSDRILGHGAPTPRSQLRHLLDHAGLEHSERPASAHFRLIHDSDEQRLRAEGGSAARIFEVVAGAALTASGPPDAEFAATTTATTNRGQPLAYVRRAKFGSDGRAVLRVAYPGQYVLQIAGRSVTATVEEADVQLGKPVSFTEHPQHRP